MDVDGCLDGDAEKFSPQENVCIDSKAIRAGGRAVGALLPNEDQIPKTAANP